MQISELALQPADCRAESSDLRLACWVGWQLVVMMSAQGSENNRPCGLSPCPQFACGEQEGQGRTHCP